MSKPDTPKEIKFLEEQRFHWILILSISAFFVLFLILFLPFGVNEPQKELTLRLAAELSLFGLFIFFTLLVNEFFIRRPLIRFWTWPRFVGWLGWLVFFSGTMNFLLYNYLQSWYDFSWSSYIQHVLNVGTVEFFPMVGVYYYFRHQQLQSRVHKLSQVDETQTILNTLVNFQGNAEMERIQLRLQDVLFLESDDNYVIIHYLDGTKLRKEVLRSTLATQEKTEHPIDFLQRIHRSYLVNIYQVESISGNVQKSKIKLRHWEVPFPVSRSFVHQVRARITNS